MIRGGGGAQALKNLDRRRIRILLDRAVEGKKVKAQCREYKNEERG